MEIEIDFTFIFVCLASVLSSLVHMTQGLHSNWHPTQTSLPFGDNYQGSKISKCYILVDAHPHAHICKDCWVNSSIGQCFIQTTIMTNEQIWDRHS